MRRNLLTVGILLLCAASAFAGPVNEIVLGASANGQIKFTGTALGHFKVDFSIMNPAAFGTGSLTSAGFYSIVNGGSLVNSAGSCGSGCFWLNQSGPLAFKYGTLAGGSDLLTGGLSLVNIQQSATHTTGVFNESLLINFTVTGGSLASAFTNSNGIVQITIHFLSKIDLSKVTAGAMYKADVTSGAVFPVPEPITLALLGASLVGLGAAGKKARLFA